MCCSVIIRVMSPVTPDVYGDFSPLGESPSPIEILIAGNSSLRIDRYGGKIIDLILAGKTILYEPKRYDDKQAATHPCTPNFGPDGRNVEEDKRLPQHGPGRNSVWEKAESKPNELKIRLGIDGEKYPEFEGLEVEQIFKLVDGELTIETTHSNNGAEEMPVNFGEHFYFNALYGGWDKLTINEQPVAEMVRQTGVLELGRENIISGLEAGEIVLKQEGLSKAVLWTGRNADETIFDNHYVCIEPVEGDPVKGNDPGFFGTEASMIKAGESRKTMIKLSLK